MAQTLYFSDAELLARVGSLTNTDLDTEAERTAIVSTPACAVVDAWFPFIAPFAASPSTPDLVKAGALELAAWITFRYTSKNPGDDLALMAFENAKIMFGYDEATKKATAMIQGVDTPSRFAVVDVTRSILDEDRDEDENRSALYP